MEEKEKIENTGDAQVDMSAYKHSKMKVWI